MLAGTSDVLTRNKISSARGLEQRLYEQLGGATIAGVLNHVVGEIFSNAYKAISFVSLADGSVQQAMTEERRVLFDGRGPIRKVPLHNMAYALYLSEQPAFVQVQGPTPIKLSKTLLGEMVGDIFAVSGICAGSDPVLEYPMSSALGHLANPGGLDTPLLSLLMAEWSNEDRDNPSLAGFIRESKLLGGDAEKRNAVDLRVSKAAKRMDKLGFVVYNQLHVAGKNLYKSAGREPHPADIPAGAGKYAAIAAWNAIKHNAYPASEISERTNYALGYTWIAIKWLVENGYAEKSEGKLRNRHSEILGTKKSRRLRFYVEKPMELLGFYPLSNGFGSVWDAPKLDVAGLVRYRENYIDPLCAGGALRDRFENACNIAYKKHTDYANRKQKTL